MRSFLIQVSILAVAAGVGPSAAPRPVAAPPQAAAGVPPDGDPVARGQRAARTLAAVKFVPNRGQWQQGVRFAALGDTSGWLHDDGFTVRFERCSPRHTEVAADLAASSAARTRSGCVVRTRFVGAAVPTFETGAELPGKHNFFLGNDASRWCSDVPGFADVCMRGVLPGIDVQFRPLPAGRRGPFEYDLLLAPGADLTRFEARCEGASSLRIDDAGRLCARLTTPDGEIELVQEAPLAWQDTPAGRRPLRVGFRLLGECSYGFVANDLDRDCAATIDPGILWSTYLGGGATDSINGMRWRPGLGIWVGGWAGSTDFPTTVGAFRVTGGTDAFLARFAEDGSSLQFASYLGGSMGEEIRALDLGPGNEATVVGFTRSPDFPTTPAALQPAYAGASPFLDVGDGFVVRFSAAGNALQAATYLGGVFDDVVESVAVDPAGNALVAGWTSSHDFPSTPGAWRPTIGGLPAVQSDGFVARLAANLQSLVFSTFVGGPEGEQLLGVDRDPLTGDAVAVGWAIGSMFPVTANALRATTGGGIDGVVVRLSPTGSVVFSTYLGGIGTDALNSVVIAANAAIWIGGFTGSVNFPTTLNAPQRVFAAETDGVLCQLDANGQNLVFSTLLGGVGPDRVRALDVALDQIVVVGEAGAGFPVTANAFQPQFAFGNLDGFVSYFTNRGATLAYSTYLGGAGQDVMGGVALANNGFAVISGWSFSSDFPVLPGAYQDQLRGVEDGVLLKLDLLEDVGDGLAVESLATGSTPMVVGDGEHEFLAMTLENLTDRDLVVDSVRVLVAGSGSAPARVESLRVLKEDPGSAPTLVAGPLPVAVDDAEIDVALAGLLLAPRTTTILRVVGTVHGDPNGSPTEVACAVVDASAWSLHVPGAGEGPAVRVFDDGRAEGPVLVFGSLPGDADRDTERTVFDVRQQLARLGEQDRAIDCDGDGVLSLIDVRLTREALLGRATVLQVPTAVQRGSWLTLRGIFPTERSLQASLGGQTLTAGRATPREITLRVDAAQIVGTQDLVVSLDGRTILARAIAVQ